ncbi:MAG TPA: alpha/beta hydrolase [Dehalococcoidia bacterium]|nr:alpha/beta hydrolase [Dehalococcoidia bacterium]
MKLIFIHGAGNTGLVWHYQTVYFDYADAISLPGHPKGEPCHSIEGYTDWLHKYVVDKGCSEPVLIGHSMGGAVAQMYALKYPGELKAIVLIGTGARLRVRPDFLNLLESGVNASSEWARSVIEPFYERVAAEVKEKVINKALEVGVAVQLNDFRCCDKFDIMDRVDQIVAPTLVICGSEDEMTPVKYSRYLADRIAGARLVIIEGGSHFVFMERPEKVNQAIEDFLRSL